MSDRIPLYQAVANEIATDGEIPTRVVVVAEVIDADGGRSLWVSYDDNSPAWEVLGLLEFAAARERARAAESAFIAREGTDE